MSPATWPWRPGAKAWKTDRRIEVFRDQSNGGNQRTPRNSWQVARFYFADKLRHSSSLRRALRKARCFMLRASWMISAPFFPTFVGDSGVKGELFFANSRSLHPVFMRSWYIFHTAFLLCGCPGMLRSFLENHNHPLSAAGIFPCVRSSLFPSCRFFHRCRLTDRAI